MKRWFIAAFLALVGFAGTLFLLPVRDASFYWHYRLDRSQMIAKAREVAAFHGLDVRQWPVLCRSSAPIRRVLFARLQHGDPHPLLTGASAEVVFSQPQGAFSLAIDLNGRGEPLGFEIRHRPGVRLEGKFPPARAAAAVLDRYAGPWARSFQIENQGIRQGNDEVWSWSWKPPSPDQITMRLETIFENGALRSARLLPSYPAPFAERLDRDRNQVGFLATGMIVAVSAVFFLAFPAFFRGFVRRRFPVRRLPRLLAIATGAILLAAVAGSIWIDITFGVAQDLGSFATAATPMLISLSFLALVAPLLYAAGRSLITPEELRRWRGFDLLLDGRLWTRPVGEGLVGGVLAGCALSILPLLVSFPFPFTLANLVESRSIFTGAPIAVPFLGVSLLDTFALFAFLWPRCQAWNRPWLGRFVFILLGVFGLAVLRGGFDYWFGPSLAAAAALLAAFVAAYRAFGLLGVLVSGMMPPAIYLAGAWGLQPSPALHAQIPWLLLLPGALLAAGAVIITRGAAVDVDAEIAQEQDALVEAGSDRDRLRAEFNVARKAQLGMLPELPPSVDGLLLAGSCHPAREVGGDLYDFFPTADGRYGFCVADVSGKGVPASLYMAMTKGLIASAIHDSSDPAQILSWLNRHWIDHGKRKMFATMAMCFWDPRARTLEYVRAGHNPILHWTQGDGLYLSPAGVGLGLAPPRMFDRTLRRETLQLSPGDLVVLYSDGIVEAMNLDNDQFGEQRLFDAVRDCQHFSALETEREISRRVRLFMGAAPPHDDMTLLVLRAV